MISFNIQIRSDLGNTLRETMTRQTIATSGISTVEVIFEWDFVDLRTEENSKLPFRGWTPLSLQEVTYNDRLAKIDEVGSCALDSLQKHHKLITGRFKSCWQAPKKGDLVLLQCFAVDNNHSNKLSARWEGPYKLVHMTHNGLTDRLYDINTRVLVKTRPMYLKEQVHLNDLKIFVQRDTTPIGSVEMIALQEWEEVSLNKRVFIPGGVLLNGEVNERGCRWGSKNINWRWVSSTEERRWAVAG